ncbi:glycoside hydrolase [Violaceomyces palustris]|uniref:Glycoside hydrolase n=1 Tax=Violaceomyces palustris TaxID=1673888 RepID=A0ACD0NSN1_9BASI|nr:glycoside hydrolase [Violaceomyces palustris]
MPPILPIKKQAPDRCPKWTLKNSNGSIAIPALFPSVAHLDLIRAGIIDDPNIGLNEGTSRWIIDEPVWSYTADLAQFVKAHAGKGNDQFALYFQGLDAVANVSIGGKPVGHSTSAFIESIYDISSEIKSLSQAPSGGNTNITIDFHSAWLWVQEESKKEPFYPSQLTNPSAYAVIDYEYPFRNFIRKQQSDFGWDWGPAYVPVGPIKPAYIVGFKGKSAESKRSSAAATGSTGKAQVGKDNSIFVHGTSVDIHRKGQLNNLPPDQDAPWIMNVTLSLFSTEAQSKDQALLDLEIQELGLSVKGLKLSKDIKKGENEALHAHITVPSKGKGSPELWWPKAFGEPKLYDLSLKLRSGKLDSATWSKRVGFRTIVLNQQEYTEEEVATGIQPGSKWQLDLNGKSFFIQASNMIPFDTFSPRISVDRVNWVIESALAAGHNLIRIWGGGSYQSDLFYDIADEAGLLIWSEMIFACSDYPTLPNFLDNVRKEVSQNVRRTNHHPSNTFWAGNNEGELLLRPDPSVLANATVYLDQYEKIFDDVVLNEVRANTKALSYVPSSTSTGYLALWPEYVPRYKNQTEGYLYSNAEYYNYDPTFAFNVSAFNKGRAYTEFGMHSLPSIYTLDRVLTNEEAYEFNSTQVRARSKHNPPGNLSYPWPASDGQFQMSSAVELYYPSPENSSSLGPRDKLAQWAYSTQIYQADFIGYEMLYYRLQGDRKENSRGVAYWQINAIWEGTDWASIEYGGRWKLMHYLSARNQDRLAAYPLYFVGNKSLELYAISDRFDKVSGKASWTWYDFKGKKLKSDEKPFTISGIGSSLLQRYGEEDGFLEEGIELDDCWLHLVVEGQDAEGGKYRNEQFWSPSPLGQAKLVKPKVEIEWKGEGEDGLLYLVRNSGEGVAAWVNLEHPEGVVGYFTNADSSQADHGRPLNGFWLRPGEVRKVGFVPRFVDDGLKEAWKSQMTSRNLYDNK